MNMINRLINPAQPVQTGKVLPPNVAPEQPKRAPTPAVSANLSFQSQALSQNAQNIMSSYDVNSISWSDTEQMSKTLLSAKIISSDQQQMLSFRPNLGEGQSLDSLSQLDLLGTWESQLERLNKSQIPEPYKESTQNMVTLLRNLSASQSKG